MVTSGSIAHNGSGITEVGGDPAQAGVKPPNEAEKAAYCSNTMLAAVWAIANKCF